MLLSILQLYTGLNRATQSFRCGLPRSSGPVSVLVHDGFDLIPNIGPVTALAVRATIDDPAKFRRSNDIGAHLGLTPRQYQSGETDVRGRISRSGDAFTRTALFTAAHVMLTRSRQWTAIRVWGVQIAQRSNPKKAKIAVASKLAVIMHRMWRDATPFRWGAEA